MAQPQTRSRQGFHQPIATRRFRGNNVAEDVGGYFVVVEAGVGGDAGDDVVGGFDAEPCAALVEEQGGGCRRRRASRRVRGARL